MAMKPYERRAAGATVYYRLATWQPVSFSYKDNATPHATPEAAAAAAKKPGRYRISKIEDGKVSIHKDFEV